MTRTLLLTVMISFCCFFLIGCKDAVVFDQKTLQQAEKIITLVDSNVIKTFQRWNYDGTYKGSEWWSKFSADTEQYICLYHFNQDTFELKLSNPINFVKDFPCNFYFDTARFVDFTFSMCQGSISKITVVDSLRESHVTNLSIPVEKLFIAKNPFDTLKVLSKLKDELGVVFAEYDMDDSSRFNFCLSSTAMLSLFNNRQDKNLTETDGLSEGMPIKKNWVLYKTKTDESKLEIKISNH